MPVPWSAFEAAEPELAALVEERFSANPHHVLGTLAADGGPRLSGINVMVNAGELWIGSMPDARKAQDLRRDPRYALHSAPLDETLAAPDVRIRGIAAELPAEAARTWLAAHHGQAGSPEGDVFLLALSDVVVVTVADDVLRVTRWDPEHGIAIHERT